MHLELIAFSGKAHQFVEVIETVLNVDVLTRLLFTALVDVQYLTHMPTLTNFFDQQFRLHGPAAGRRRIVPDLQDFHRLLSFVLQMFKARLKVNSLADLSC